MDSRPVSAQGFTLLEVLIALVITVAAASIVLSHIRTLMDFNVRIRKHQHQVTTLLNLTASFSAMDFEHLKTDIESDHVDLLDYRADRVISRVQNFSPTRASLPPVDQAYTPYQTYKISPETRYFLILLQPGLKKPPHS